MLKLRDADVHVFVTKVSTNHTAWGTCGEARANRPADPLERFRIAFMANLRFAFMFSGKNEYIWMRIVKNNSGFWCQRKTTQFRVENENSEPQMWDKHGHVVISAVCRLP